MNIFVLDNSPSASAKQHCDKHVVKMHVEGVQMLVSVLDRWNVNHAVTTKRGTIHKGGYANHPCTRWAGDDYANFLWLLEYTDALVTEHTHRYGTHPVSGAQVQQIKAVRLQLHQAMLAAGCDNGLTPFAQAMPDEYKDDDAVTAYRDYYIAEKHPICQWNKTRPAPAWFTEAFDYASE